MDAARRRTFDTVVAAGLTGAELHFELARESALNNAAIRIVEKAF